MHPVYRGRRSIIKTVVALAIAAAAVGAAPPLARATLITSASTFAANGNGFTARTYTVIPVNLELESDAYSVTGSVNYQNSGTNTSYLEIYASIPGCGGEFSVSTQHRAYNPATGEYDFASSGADGNCNGNGGGDWDPQGEYCRNRWEQEGAQNTPPYEPQYVEPRICP
jgi:hypothetical protein